MLNFQESFVLIGLEAPDSDAVINRLAGCLHQDGVVSAQYGADTIKREKLHATGLPTKPFPIAFPHADAEGVIESALAIAILDKPVIFKNMADPDEDLPVELVIMMANKSPEEQIETLRNLAELFGQPEKLFELRNLTSTTKVLNWMREELSL